MQGKNGRPNRDGNVRRLMEIIVFLCRILLDVRLFQNKICIERIVYGIWRGADRRRVRSRKETGKRLSTAEDEGQRASVVMGAVEKTNPIEGKVPSARAGETPATQNKANRPAVGRKL